MESNSKEEGIFIDPDPELAFSHENHGDNQPLLRTPSSTSTSFTPSAFSSVFDTPGATPTVSSRVRSVPRRQTFDNDNTVTTDPVSEDSFDVDDSMNDVIPAVENSLYPTTSNPQLNLRDSASSVHVREDEVEREDDSLIGEGEDDQMEIENEEAESDAVTERFDMHGKFRGFLKDDSDSYDDMEALLGSEMMKRVNDTLQNVFHHESFRLKQKAAITSILLNNDVFLMMPTGGGKSLCYQLPAYLSEGVTVVISPLISMIQDHCVKMRELGIECVAFEGGLTMAETEEIYARLEAEKPTVKLLFLTPEKLSRSPRLFNSAFTSLHRRGLLSRFAVLEAHCVSQWGSNFRTTYAELADLRREYPQVPIVASTATATPKIVLDTKDRLGINDSKLFISSFVRDNLTYDVVRRVTSWKKEGTGKEKKSVLVRDSLDMAMKKIKEDYSGESGIIYCETKEECWEVAKYLRTMEYTVEEYHSDIKNDRRSEIQSKWMANEIQILTATIAFGMGVRKPDVRFIIHHSIPFSLEDFYQETGRAGRDGLPSYCICLYSCDDVDTLKQIVANDSPSVDVFAAQWQSINQMAAYARNISICRRKILVEHFGEIYDERACRSGPSPCDVCREKKKKVVAALRVLVAALASKHRLAGPEEVLSNEGIEQIAALLPCTNSELLQVHSMTEEKIVQFGRSLMAALEPFWKEIDDGDAAEITAQLESQRRREE